MGTRMPYRAVGGIWLCPRQVNSGAADVQEVSLGAVAGQTPEAGEVVAEHLNTILEARGDPPRCPGVMRGGRKSSGGKRGAIMGRHQ
jgi:hypothetical protein